MRLRQSEPLRADSMRHQRRQPAGSVPVEVTVAEMMGALGLRRPGEIDIDDIAFYCFVPDSLGAIQLAAGGFV
jgi:hypothetical protein